MSVHVKFEALKFSPVFEEDTRITFVYNFVAPLNNKKEVWK